MTSNHATNLLCLAEINLWSAMDYYHRLSYLEQISVLTYISRPENWVPITEDLLEILVK